MPAIFQVIDAWIILSKMTEHALQETISNHQMIMKVWNPEGTRSVMKIHILRSINDFRN